MIRQNMRKINSQINYDDSELAKLDASLKKNTAFIKKLRNIQEDNRESLIKEMQGLKLSKYLTEVISALVENKFNKSQDVLAAAHITCLIHQRYTEFHDLFLPVLLKSFDVDDILRQRSSLRYLTELCLCGMIKDELLVCKQIKKMMKNDYEFLYLPTMASFLKHYGNEFVKEPSVQEGTTQMVLGLFKAYFQGASKKILQVHKDMKKKESENNDHVHTKGELTDAMKTEYENLVKTFDRLQSNMGIFCEVLKVEQPELKEEQVTRIKSMIVEKGPTLESPVILSCFEDEDTRMFYESVVDVSLMVPKSTLEKEEEEEKIVSVFDDFLKKLPDLVNRDLIDKAAVEYCYLNTKSRRKRLIKALLSVPRIRLELLPYYARLIACLHSTFPDIASSIQSGLEEEFDDLVKKKDPNLVETKIKNVRFVGELIKFKLVPTHVAFTFLSALLDDFSFSHHVEMASHLLEVCGRYLYLKPETNVRLVNLLQIMQKKKIVSDPRLCMLVDNAFFMCQPPEAANRKIREKTAIERYLLKLIFKDLNDKTVKEILKVLRMFDWNDPNIFELMLKVFKKIHKVKYSNIHLMAALVVGISKYHSEFGVRLVDCVTEAIRLDLELNQFRNNQKRIAMVIYLGELYNYRVVESDLIFETLSLILTFGHENGQFTSPTPLDSHSDLFRIRLCCSILSTCGRYFDRGYVKRQLDAFLVYFQYYIHSKTQLSMDIEFMIQDVFEELRPKFKLFKSMEEASKALSDIYSHPMTEEVSPISEPIKKESAKEEEEINYDDFDKELNELVSEGVKQERKLGTFDVPIPVKVTKSDKTDVGISFSLLTKKGTKQQVKEISVPVDSPLAVQTLMHQEAERQEQLRLKKLVLESQLSSNDIVSEQPTKHSNVLFTNQSGRWNNEKKQ